MYEIKVEDRRKMKKGTPKLLTLTIREHVKNPDVLGVYIGSGHGQRCLIHINTETGRVVGRISSDFFDYTSCHIDNILKRLAVHKEEKEEDYKNYIRQTFT